MSTTLLYTYNFKNAMKIPLYYEDYSLKLRI